MAKRMKSLTKRSNKDDNSDTDGSGMRMVKGTKSCRSSVKKIKDEHVEQEEN